MSRFEPGTLADVFEKESRSMEPSETDPKMDAAGVTLEQAASGLARCAPRGEFRPVLGRLHSPVRFLYAVRYFVEAPAGPVEPDAAGDVFEPIDPAELPLPAAPTADSRRSQGSTWDRTRTGLMVLADGQRWAAPILSEEPSMVRYVVCHGLAAGTWDLYLDLEEAGYGLPLWSRLLLGARADRVLATLEALGAQAMRDGDKSDEELVQGQKFVTIRARYTGGKRVGYRWVGAVGGGLLVHAQAHPEGRVVQDNWSADVDPRVTRSTKVSLPAGLLVLDSEHSGSAHTYTAGVLSSSDGVIDWQVRGTSGPASWRTSRASACGYTPSRFVAAQSQSTGSRHDLRGHAGRSAPACALYPYARLSPGPALFSCKTCKTVGCSGHEEVADQQEARAGTLPRMQEEAGGDAGRPERWDALLHQRWGLRRGKVRACAHAGVPVSANPDHGMSYETWRDAVCTEMVRRGFAETTREASKILASSEEGPLACVPSMRELWADGETPADFVANEFAEGPVRWVYQGVFVYPNSD